MSDYTPSTDGVRRSYAYVRSSKPDHKNQSAIAEFDRWLAAHDAEVLAAAGVTPQPEPDDFWEYKEIGRGGEYITYRRPKWSAPVGAWEPVPNQDGEK